MKLHKRLLCALITVLLLVALLPAGVIVAHAATGTVTRAQWISALTEIFSMTVDADNYPDNYYSDISDKDSFYRDIMVAVEFGVVDLEAGQPFRPNDPATREFAAQTLNFCLGFQLEEGAAYTFKEAASVTCPADIQVAVNRKWFALSGDSFLPQQAITAAEKTAMLQDAKTVLASDAVDTGYENAYKFADGVIVLPDTTVYQQESDNVITIAAPAKKLAAKDLFVLFADGLPTVYRADAVSVSGNVYTVTVTAQNVNEYLVSMDAQGSMEGSLADFEVAEGLDAMYVLEDNTRVRSVKAAGTKKIQSIYFNKTFSNLTVAIELYDMKLDWQAKGSVLDRSSVKVKAIVTGKTFCNASLAFGASVADFAGPLVLGTYPIAGLGDVTVTANISIDGSITVSYGANFKTGITYSYQDGFRLPREFKKTHFSLCAEATLDFSVTARASVYGIPMLSANCYATVGMKANFVARYRGAGKAPLWCLHTDSWLYAQVGASATVGFESKLFGADTFQKKWSQDLIIWDRNTSPARSVTHHEDGRRVTSCTYGETNFFGYNSFYWSSLGSRYANGGVSAVANVPTYTYTTDDDGNATITGYSGGFAALSLPATIDGHKVVAIGDNAFKGHKELVTVTLPASVTSIGTAAFSGCHNLRNLNLPEGLLTIGNYAFDANRSLVYVKLPESLTKLGCGAFKDCASLQRVHIPKGMNTGDYCGSNYMYPAPFSNCTSLTDVTFSQGITSLPNALFGDCYGLTSIVIPDTVTALNWKTFQSCRNLESVTLSANLTDIGGSCFMNCEKLTQIVLPESMQVLGCGAFENCTALESINIPKNMRTGDYCGNSAYPGPFKNCSSLNKITFAEGITRLPDGLFSDCTGLTEITIPDTVTALNWKVFQSCKNLKSVKLSKNLTDISSSCFIGCTALKEISLPDGMQVLGCGAFENCTALESVNIPKNMRTGDYCGNSAYPGPFKNCSSLNKITFAEGITRLPDGLFGDCTGLTQITIPDTVTTLNWVVFQRCTNLKSVTLPNSLTTLASRAFYASGLESVTIPDTVTSVGDHILADCPNLKTAVWPAGTTTVPDYAFAGSGKLETVTIPDTVTTFKKGVFRSCKSLTMETLPESVTQVGEELFYDCDGIKKFTIPGGLTELNKSFFHECDGLTEIAIPANITTVSHNVFEGCDNLTKVTMTDTVTSLGGAVFRYSAKLKDVRLSQSLTKIPSEGFRGCAALEQIVIPHRVTAVEGKAFLDCIKLAKVVTGEKLTSINTSAFPYAQTTVFYGAEGSYTQIFAEANGFRFQANNTQPTKVTLSWAELTLAKGKTARLITTVAPVDFAGPVVLKSSDTAVVTVTDAGELKAVGVGSATIKVTAGSASASCKVTVTQAVTGLRLNKTSASLQLPATLQLTATVTPADAGNKTLTWTSSNPAAATVDGNGLVTAVGNGTAVITAATQDGSNLTATCTVTVTDPNNIPVTSIKLSATTLTLDALAPQQLTATVSPSNAANKVVRWISSDETVATVDENGMVTGLKKGTATITATAADGYGATAACQVTVTGNGYIVTDPAQLESPHNYLTDCRDAWRYTMSGATALEVTFDGRTEMEDSFDFLYIYDGQNKQVGKYTGTALAGKTITVPGDTVCIRMASDDSGTAWGFKVTAVTAKTGPVGDCNGDGKLDTNDAVYLLLHIMFGAEDYPMAAGVKTDTNGDGKLDTNDAVYLLLHVMFGAEDYPI